MSTSNRLRALIVDDTEEIRKLSIRALQQKGYKCDEARDGVMAANLTGMYKYDVIISDLRMPRAHGHQFLLDLIESKNPAMLVAITGLSEPSLFKDLIGRGVEDVIHKPFSPVVFAAKVHALYERRRKQSVVVPVAEGANPVSSIAETSAALKEQLASITSHFQATINQLERQKADTEAAHIESMRLLTGLIEGIPKSGGSHVRRVEDLAVAIAESAGVKKAELITLRAACLLHEVGLIGAPDTIRTKAPWALTPEERTNYERYPVLSATIVSGIPGAEGCSSLIEQHMENFDGSGFPQGLKGEAIPLSARIIRIADGVDTYRLYANTKQDPQAIKNHLKKEQERAYDPALVTLMLEHLKKSALEQTLADQRTIQKHDLAPGMKLAENVYNEYGQFLMRQHTRLDVSSAARLKQVLPEGTMVRVCGSWISPQSAD